MQERLTAIDLYAGIGGWATGFHLAGVKTVAAWEWWSDACDTYEMNFGLRPICTDIRKLALEDLPAPGTVDYVVGSPPCTEFSYSNRGGNGDIANGLIDIRKFLEVVQYLKPKYWAMENVPRVAEILRSETELGGSLHQFSDLIKHIIVVSAARYGAPQDRQRMIAGNFPLGLFIDYAAREPVRTLGHVVTNLGQVPPTDPVYATGLTDIVDHDPEPDLTTEESRINRQMKTYHPVYNNMPFPDRLDRPARTITATCTRVSRESIVIESETGGYRRLTVRERASAQGFPVSFMFSGRTVNARYKMAGNAIPPPLAYYLAHAMLEHAAEDVPNLQQLSFSPASPEHWRPVSVENPPRTYPIGRAFRHCIPGLRFKSGVRVELKNHTGQPSVNWSCDFYYGSSKAIRRGLVSQGEVWRVLAEIGWELSALQDISSKVSDLYPSEPEAQRLQMVWCHRSDGSGPFELADLIGEHARQLLGLIQLMSLDDVVRACMTLYPDLNRGKRPEDYQGILAGAIVTAAFNPEYNRREREDRQLLLALERPRVASLP